MGITSFSQEFKCSISPSRMFKALILDSNNLFPKLLPQLVKSIQIIQGDGGAGSIEQVNFTEGSKLKYAKHRIDEVDEKNLACKYTIIEGDTLGDKFESVAHEVKFEAASDGGCICKMTSCFQIIGGFELKEEEIQAGKEKAIGICKLVEKYLSDNPQVYT